MEILLFCSSHKIFPVLAGKEEAPAPNAPEEAPTGRWERLLAKVRHSYQQFQERFDYHENLCARLRQAHAITLVYSPSHHAGETERAFRKFLRQRGRKHWRWFWVDLFLAALGTLLVPLPGPNVFFFYPAARCFSHHLARKGAEHAGRISRYGLVQEPLMREVEEKWGQFDQVRQVIQTLEQRYGCEGLEKVIGRL